MTIEVAWPMQLRGFKQLAINRLTVVEGTPDAESDRVLRAVSQAFNLWTKAEVSVRIDVTEGLDRILSVNAWKSPKKGFHAQAVDNQGKTVFSEVFPYRAFLFDRVRNLFGS